MNYRKAVSTYGIEEVREDLFIWWVSKIDEEKYKIMSTYLTKEKKAKKKDKIVCVDGHTYIKDVPVEFGTDRVKLQDGSVKIISKIKKINVMDYKNMYWIDGELYRRIK